MGEGQGKEETGTRKEQSGKKVNAINYIPGSPESSDIVSEPEAAAARLERRAGNPHSIGRRLCLEVRKNEEPS
jgi:hypothetical protein